MNYLLIGKPNVGKSSIFNFLTGTNINIIHPESGTTRDWHKESIKNSTSLVYDTPGLLIDNNNLNLYFRNILKNRIDFFLYVVDFTHRYNLFDHTAINNLRKYNKEIILIVNKFDNHSLDINSKINTIYYKYGIKKMFFISCAHHYGFDKLFSAFASNKSNLNLKDQFDFSLAIFGKPNAGKSTFLNTVLGFERSVTSSIAGTTSDYVIDYLNYKKKIIKIIDTAGIGKKSNIKKNSINFLSVKKAFENIKKVDSAIIIVDSVESIDRQDKRIIKLVSEKSKSIILIFNKIDLIINDDNFKSDIISDIKNNLSEVKNIKIFFISALKKNNINKIINYLYDFIFFKDYIISTSKLNTWLKKVVIESQHPMIDNKRVNFKYAVQIKSKPVTIKIFCSYSNKLKESYKRYLMNKFNYHFKILNQKTKFIFSSSKNPYI